jgi:hypothetical protein
MKHKTSTSAENEKVVRKRIRKSDERERHAHDNFADADVAKSKNVLSITSQNGMENMEPYPTKNLFRRLNRRRYRRQHRRRA